MTTLLRRSMFAALSLWLGMTASTSAAQDFDPSGRGRRAPRLRPPKRPAARARRPKRNGRQALEARIKRYTAIVLRRPHEPVPLRKLFELYRQRDGSIDQMVSNFERRARDSGSVASQENLALAAIYVHAKRDEQAQALLKKVADAKPRLASPRLLLGQLAERRDQLSDARNWYRQALPLVNHALARETLRRKLMLLSLDLKDYQAATGHHRALLRLAKGSMFVRRELADELFKRQRYARATKAYRSVVRAAHGDNRALAPALANLGRSLAKEGKMDEALTTLRRARRLAGRQAGIRNQILVLLTEIFRERGKLGELITMLEKERGRDRQAITTLAGLYEEVGRVDIAITTYRKALAMRGAHRDTRVKLVALLQAAGRLEEAIEEYEALIRAAPDNPEYVFDLANTLIQRGERSRALKLVKKLARRVGKDTDVLMAIADFYEGIDESKRAIAILERLAKDPGHDPQPLIDLGDRYFQAGDTQRAIATWKRIPRIIRSTARAASILGEVYLEHDMPQEALTSLRKAVKFAPKNKRYVKQLAIALERTAPGTRRSRHTYREALAIWQQLLAQSSADPLLARECRTHMVSLWSVLRVLSNQVGPLMTRVYSTPPDLQAARLLAEVQRRLRRLGDAERTLRLLHQNAPADRQTLLSLERILVMQRKLDKAIGILKKLRRLDPKRARAYYQRMANYAAELYRDDEAIGYAAQAVALSPDDARGHYRLAKMYRRRRDNDRAIAELRRAIQKNDRLFQAYFDLAEMLVSLGKATEADRLYRRVLRTSRDEQYISRATRLSMQINLGRGTLESLERALLPIALDNPQKPIYRRLLVELYGAMTLPLVHTAKFGESKAAQRARAQLAAVGSRAVKPLLDALADSREQQQRIGIEVLSYVQNKSAGAALFNFASGNADRDLRMRAMLACGTLGDTAMWQRFGDFLEPSTGAQTSRDPVAVAATWGLARLGEKRARRLMTRLMNAPSPEMRALAALGLGRIGAHRDAAKLLRVASSVDSGPLTRAAAITALGNFKRTQDRPHFLAFSESEDVTIRRATLIALARSAPPPSAKPTPLSTAFAARLADALLQPDTLLQQSALAAATLWHDTSKALGKGLGATWALPVGRVDVQHMLRASVPPDQTATRQAASLLMLGDALAEAARTAVATSPDRAEIVAQLITSGWRDRLNEQSGDPLPAETLRELTSLSQNLADATRPAFVALARHPNTAVRKTAIELLAKSPHITAQQVIVDALSDDDASVVSVTLSAMRIPEPNSMRHAARLLREAQRWPTRAHAARALGRLSAEAERRQLWT
ncbi:MAG: tetratricopeptide repeat protein, partial [Polyangiaceae bacterium]